MNEIDSPAGLLVMLTAMFPEFASEFEDDEKVTTYHQIVLRLSPVICGYLRDAPLQVSRFCDLINALVAAGGARRMRYPLACSSMHRKWVCELSSVRT